MTLKEFLRSYIKTGSLIELKTVNENIWNQKLFTLDELKDKFQEFIFSDDYAAIHGDIGDRAKNFQWGIRIFLDWLNK